LPNAIFKILLDVFGGIYFVRKIQATVLLDFFNRLATIDDKIIADGALELNPFKWTEHIAEMRLVIARPYQRKGLGMIMARELYQIAAEKNVENILVKFLKPQEGAKKIFQKLGFKQEYLMHNFAKDLNGRRQDMIVMTCEMDNMYKELEQLFQDTDWKGSEFSGV
jgi:ribosomal protein S18 acetylase RimI-like enzyme